jgi:two-component system LytT family response regulator
MEIKTVIIDDEPLAIEELNYLLNNYPEIKVVDYCKNAFDAIKSINKNKPHLIFLDIQMPLMDGFEMLSLLDEANMPYVIFSTAYDQYAIKAFEEKSIDYLLKPIEQNRLDVSIKKAIDIIGKGQVPKYDNFKIKKIPCSLNNIVKLIDTNEVDYVVSDLTGIHLFVGNQMFLTDLSLKVLEEKTDLFRCHRQYLINLNKIKEIRFLDNGLAEAVITDDVVIPVSRRNLKNLKLMLGIN